VALLGLDALAPVVGAASTLMFKIPDSGLLVYLGFFAGFLLYIGASDILPEAHAAHPSLPALGFTVAGTGLKYVTLTVLR
jgi:zinc transporter, ZIP family